MTDHPQADRPRSAETARAHEISARCEKATKGPWEVLIVFQQFFILADRNGVVDMTPDAISRRTTVPLDIIQKGIAVLEQPDPHSRTPDENGRRLVRLSDSRPWGWRIVNHAKYRGIRSQEERREYMRQYQRQRRKGKDVNQSVNNVSNVNQCSKQNAGSNKKQPLSIGRKKGDEAFIAALEGPAPFEQQAADRRGNGAAAHQPN